jgi:hypothetical protein
MADRATAYSVVMAALESAFPADDQAERARAGAQACLIALMWTVGSDEASKRAYAMANDLATARMAPQTGRPS